MSLSFNHLLFMMQLLIKCCPHACNILTYHHRIDSYNTPIAWYIQYLFCSPIPPFRIQWLMNGTVIQQEMEGVLTSTLMISPVEFKDQGSYICRVINGRNIWIDASVGSLKVYGIYINKYIYIYLFHPRYLHNDTFRYIVISHCL